MKYGTICSDPPWPEAHPGSWPYPLMENEEILALDVESLAADDAYLFLWTTQRSLEFSYQVAEAWGFQRLMTLVWCKPMGPGQKWFRPSLEFIQFCVRGNPPPIERRDLPCHFHWPRKAHSQKPEAFYDLVEEIAPGPWLEMFSRRARLGWDVWGNEVGSTIEIQEVEDAASSQA